LALPGISTRIKDRFYSLSRTDIPVGPRVLAIGTRTTTSTSVNGLVSDLDPYNATKEDDVVTEFGEGSQLHRAYLELVAGGAQRITLIALPADTTFNHSNATISSATFDAANPADDLWDTAWGAIEAAQPDIVVPWGRGGHPSTYNDEASTVTDEPLGFYADNNSSAASSWAAKVASKVADITSDSHPCFAVMGVKPFSTSTGSEVMTPAQISTHVGFSDLVSRETITDGIYLVVVAAEVKPVGSNYDEDWGFSNGAGMFAGHVAQLDSWSSPTGKVIFNVEKLRYGLTRSQQESLIDKGVVPVAVNYNKYPAWVDAMTFSKATSDYTRLTTLRIVFDAVEMVRQATQKFIGEASSLEARNSIDTAITSGLRGMQQVGALLSSDFTVSYLPRENKALVDLVLNPAFELRNIEVSVSVQL
jgi:hypothetical protein